MNTNARLNARIVATNRVHAYALNIYPALSEYFTPFVGCKILKADGYLLAKVTKDMPTLENNHRIQCFIYSDAKYSLKWLVRSSESDGDGIAHYGEIVLYIADMQDGVLTKICPKPDYRCDYTVEEFEAKRAAYKIAKEAADKARSALFPFGENDR